MKIKNSSRKNRSLIGCLFAFSIFLCSAVQSHAQQFQTVFANSSYNLSGYDVHEVSDGYVLCSEVPNVIPTENITIVIKTDFNGKLIWQRKYDGSYSKFEPLSGGGFILAGRTTGYIALYRLDDDGHLVWSKKYSATSGMAVNNVLETKHNGNQAFLIIGSYFRPWVSGPGSIGSDFLAIKTEDDGDVIWAHCYGRNTLTVYNNLYDYGHAAIEISSGDPDNPDFLITGFTNGYLTSHQNELYVVKVTGSTGAKTFDKLYVPLYPIGHASYVPYYNYGKSIVKDNSTNYAICGQSNNITTIDASGAVQWCKNYSGGSNITLNNIVKDVNNTGYGVGLGYTTGLEGCLMKIGFNGAVSWTKNYEGVSSYVGATSDYGYLVGSALAVTAESGKYGYLLVKTNASGQSGCYETSETIGAADVPYQVVNLGGDDVTLTPYITAASGFSEDQPCLRKYDRDCITPATTTFVAGGPATYTVSEGAFSIYSFYYINEPDIISPDYDIKWTLIESGPTYTDVTELAPDENYTQARPKTGFQKFINPVVRTDKTLCVDVSYAGCKVRQCFGRNPAYGYNFREESASSDNSVADPDMTDELLLSPNPASNKVLIRLPNNEGGKIEFLDSKGTVVKTIEANDAAEEVNISQLPKGLYFVRVTQSAGIRVSKLEVY